ncbi:MAG: hypothetical protein HYU66_17440 [Armatimonadetes bacterium]|nr:hypothetical protein [Armatimonadota bacterium]
MGGGVQYSEAWALSLVPLGKSTGLTYWDAGGWGGLGLQDTAEHSEHAMVFHAGQTGPEFAAADTARLRNRPEVSVR